MAFNVVRRWVGVSTGRWDMSRVDEMNDSPGGRKHLDIFTVRWVMACYGAKFGHPVKFIKIAEKSLDVKKQQETHCIRIRDCCAQTVLAIPVSENNSRRNPFPQRHKPPS